VHTARAFHSGWALSLKPRRQTRYNDYITINHVFIDLVDHGEPQVLRLLPTEVSYIVSRRAKSRSHMIRAVRIRPDGEGGSRRLRRKVGPTGRIGVRYQPGTARGQKLPIHFQCIIPRIILVRTRPVESYDRVRGIQPQNDGEVFNVDGFHPSFSPSALRRT
jgi:hypothetical protein